MSTFSINQAFTDPASTEQDDSLVLDADSWIEIIPSVELANGLVGSQFDVAAGLACSQFGLLGNAAAGLLGSKFDAAGLLGSKFDAAGLAGSQFDVAAGLACSQFGLLGNAAAGLLGSKFDAAGLLSSQFDSLGGVFDLTQLLEGFSVLARPDRAVATLDREQIRQLWSQYVYLQVWLICFLLLLLVTMRLGKFDNSLLTVYTGATGVCGKSAASKASKIAFDNFDRIFPLGRKMPAITNVMI